MRRDTKHRGRSDRASVDAALDAPVDHVVPGRSVEVRPPTRRELEATSVVKVPLRESSLKVRAGGVLDEPEDLASPSGLGSCR